MLGKRKHASQPNRGHRLLSHPIDNNGDAMAWLVGRMTAWKHRQGTAGNGHIDQRWT